MELVPTNSLTETVGHYVSARNLWSGARILLERPDYVTGTDLYQPAHALLGFAVENYLKAFLLKQGTDSRSLRRPPLNHDLALLHANAKTLGLYVPGTGLDGIVQVLAPHHGQDDYGTRYLVDGNYTKVHPQPVISVMAALDSAVTVALSSELTAYLQQ